MPLGTGGRDGCATDRVSERHAIHVRRRQRRELSQTTNATAGHYAGGEGIRGTSTKGKLMPACLQQLFVAVAGVLLLQAILFVRWLWRRTIIDKITETFVRDIATIHRPYVRGLLQARGASRH